MGFYDEVSNVRVVDFKPSEFPLVVDFLRGLLARAERGELNFVAVVATQPDGCVVDGWAQGVDVRPYNIVGGMECLKMRFVSKNIEVDE